MVDLRDIRYVRLGTRDLEAATRFATDVLRLECGQRERRLRYFRSDRRDHTLVYFDGDPADQSVGFEVAHLDAAAAGLDRLGVDVQLGNAGEAELRRVPAFVHFRDPSGNRIELVAAAADPGARTPPGVDPAITGFSHVGLHSTDRVRDEAFWTEALGARVSDRIGDAPLLRIDPVHHRIALFPSSRSGVHHVNHQLATLDDVMRAYYRLKAAGVPIVFGPGRHPTSGACFVYFCGPDGMVYEFSSGVRLISPERDATHQPRQFPRQPESFCIWGSRPRIAEFQAASPP